MYGFSDHGRRWRPWYVLCTWSHSLPVYDSDRRYFWDNISTMSISLGPSSFVLNSIQIYPYSMENGILCDWLRMHSSPQERTQSQDTWVNHTCVELYLHPSQVVFLQTYPQCLHCILLFKIIITLPCFLSVFVDKPLELCTFPSLPSSFLRASCACLWKRQYIYRRVVHCSLYSGFRSLKMTGTNCISGSVEVWGPFIFWQTESFMSSASLELQDVMGPRNLIMVYPRQGSSVGHNNCLFYSITFRSRHQCWSALISLFPTENHWRGHEGVDAQNQRILQHGPPATLSVEIFHLTTPVCPLSR